MLRFTDGAHNRGSLTENLPRLLPEGLKIMIEAGSWEIPQIFICSRLGGLMIRDVRTFNMGVGYVVITPEESADRVIKIANNRGILGWVIGRVERGRGGVSYCPGETWCSCQESAQFTGHIDSIQSGYLPVY